MPPPPTEPAAPKRRAAYEARRLAFARAFCRLGQAAAAYREAFPASRAWQADSTAKEAARLMRDPIVKTEIGRIDADAHLDAIPYRQEIARTLVDIMRGNLTETRTVMVKRADGSHVAEKLEVAPSLTVRLRAAKDLDRILPAVSPKAPGEAESDKSADSFDATLAEIRKRRAKDKP